MTITIRTDEFVQLLEDMLRGLDLSQGLGDEIGAIMCSDILRQFQSGGDPMWPGLAQSTIEQKRRMGYPRLTREGLPPQTMVQRGIFGPQNILMRTGALLSSWSNPQDPDHIHLVENGSVTEGSGVPYATFHQNGGAGGRPPVRSINVTPQMLAEVSARLDRAIAGGHN